jgi:hypothetical protein
MTIETLLAHMPERLESAILPEIQKYGVGSGYMAHALDCCVFQPAGMSRDEWRSRPVYFFKPLTAECWGIRSASVHAWQQTIIPAKDETIESETESAVRRLSRE